MALTPGPTHMCMFPYLLTHNYETVKKSEILATTTSLWESQITQFTEN